MLITLALVDGNWWFYTIGRNNEHPNTGIKYLTLADVLDIHRGVMRLSGGLGGVLNIGNLAFALEHIRGQSYTGEMDDIFMKCAVLGQAIIQGHPFIDGNKRTGLEVIELFLNWNGYRLDNTIDEVVEFAINVAKGSCSLQEMKKWIRSYSEKHLYTDAMVRESGVKYMTDDVSEKSRPNRENPYNISEEMMAMIDASIKRNKKLLEELAKY